MSTPNATLRVNGSKMITVRVEHHVDAIDTASILAEHMSVHNLTKLSMSAATDEIRRALGQDGWERIQYADALLEFLTPEQRRTVVKTVRGLLTRMGFDPEDVVAAEDHMWNNAGMPA